MIRDYGNEPTLELTVQRAEQQLQALQLAASRTRDSELDAVVGALFASLFELKIAGDQLRERNNKLADELQRELQTRISRDQLRELARRQQTVQEQERADLARELHDEFGAALTALKLDLHWIMARLPSGVKSLQEKATGMSELIDRTVESVSRTGARLRPRVLDDFGLVAAIDWQTQDFRGRTGIQCKAQLPDYVELDPKLSIAVFRILQEALTNVALHANATEVMINLRVDGGAVFLEVKDNGVGINQEQASNEASFGLLGMKERAYVFGGRVCLDGRESQGTTVRVEIPRIVASLEG
ncbi:MAG: sensor histidine kinase [Candidatus Binatia bacterium]